VDERQALLDLVDSDMPLDRVTRGLLARDLQDYYFPSRKSELNRRRNQLRESLYHYLKAALRKDGWNARDAEGIAAQAVGKNLEAIDRQIRRDRKRKRAK
jgi:hypothetical protein